MATRKESSSVNVKNMSTLALENKLKQLREASNTVSTKLTQKLASSRSGQDLLHIGTSLSSLPPDLHLLQKELQPMVVAAEETESTLKKEIESLVNIKGTQVQFQQSRITQAQECAELYQDLVAAEEQVENEKERNTESFEEEKEEHEDLDLVLGLERAALAAVCLIDQVNSSTARVSTMTSQKLKDNAVEDSTEQAQFILKLAPRIRRLENQVIACLTNRLEKMLQDLQTDSEIACSKDDLLMFGHCMRGLAVLGRGKDIESVFARVAIMPCIRSKVSMGTLDSGGGRGECTGLPALLDEVATTITSTYGAILQLSEAMDIFGVDLVTEGVWVPIATTLMADPGIKMAIFSPGIASVLQANYSALDAFLSNLATQLLQQKKEEEPQRKEITSLQDLYFEPDVTPDMIQKAQERIYRHAITSDFSKKWNLPIYYQLRFGETCTRLNTAMDSVQVGGGWETSMVFTGSPEEAERMRNVMGLELPVFMELYDILLSLWKPDVIIRPLSHRFLRGSVQLVGRMVVFCQDGLDKKIQFGQEAPTEEEGETENGVMNGDSSPTTVEREPYYWAENPRDVAVVAWDLTVLGTSLTHDYVETVCKAIVSKDAADNEELRQLVSQVLTEAAEPIGALVGKCWNNVIVDILTSKCCGPLAAVKGVGATYRMTNRPPPTKASPFVSMVLRPLSEFVTEFDSRTPPQVGSNWKLAVVSTVALRYSVAVEELLATIERTEVALRNRRARRGVASGGMSDGEKVKLQLYLDYKEFASHVESLLGSSAMQSIEGLVKLSTLTVVESEG